MSVDRPAREPSRDPGWIQAETVRDPGMPAGIGVVVVFAALLLAALVVAGWVMS